ncbi:MAG: hypothetical protein LBO66_02070, partial [Deltaproteobacteria bacterium]|nr:hypothetical protein [Deltaproteobacteria bacterium]
MPIFSEHSPTGWRERGARSAAFALASLALLLLLALAPRPYDAAAGQEVTLTGPLTITHDVFGNGDPQEGYDAPSPGYLSSLTLPPDGNAVRAVGAVNVTTFNIVGGAAMAIGSGVSVGYNLVIAEGAGQTMASSDGAIYGGQARGVGVAGDATARENWIVAADGGELTAKYYIHAGFADTEYGVAQAYGNQIAAFNGGSLNSGETIYAGRAVSEFGDAQAFGNRVIVDDGGAIYAPRVYGGLAGYGAFSVAANNRVEISYGVITERVIGGYANSLDGLAIASDNLVAISGGVISGRIAGGYTESAGVNNAVNNRVEISGVAIISGDIIGGAVTSYSNSSSVAAHDNRVDISGTPILTGASLYGGYKDFGTGDVFSGNALNLKASGLTAMAIANFEFLNFYLPASARAEDVILTISGVASFQDDAVSQFSTVSMAIPGAATPLKPGERIILIGSANPLDGSPANGAVAAAQGVALTHDFRLDASGNQLVATLAG